MFDHVTLRASDRAASEDFYAVVLKALGVEPTHRDGELVEWSDFSLMQATDERGPTRRLHLGFAAPSRAHVDAFWRAGIEAGHPDDGRPGPRPQYREDYYGAFLLDPDGNSAEAVHHGALGRGGVLDHLWIRVADVAAARSFYLTVAPHAGLRLRDDGPERVRFAGASGSFSLVAGRRPSTCTWRSARPATATWTPSTGPRWPRATATTARPASARSTTRATTRPTRSTPTAPTSRSWSTTGSERQSTRRLDRAMSTGLPVITLGTHRIENPAPGEPPFLSAASGAAWSGRRLYSVGDDQAAVAEFELDEVEVLEALRSGKDADILPPGFAERIIPDVLPLDPGQRASQKADFEALTLVTRTDLEALEDETVRRELLRRFPHGLLIMAGSGGVSWEGVRRSTCVVYSRDEDGHIVGLPAKVSLEGLHAYLEESPWLTGELNIEGMAVHGRYLVLAQRGNSTAPDGRPADNLLIRLSLSEVLESFYTDLRVGRCELEEIRSSTSATSRSRWTAIPSTVKLDFTDPRRRHGRYPGPVVFTAAGEGTDARARPRAASPGSIVGVIDADGNVERTYPLARPGDQARGRGRALQRGRRARRTSCSLSDADDPGRARAADAARLPAE
jgi:catechol 2,3-dioxygenase-like lactoylglutathione lyase family enzyme